MRLKKVSFFVVLLLLTLLSGARAQYLWHVQVTNSDWHNVYGFTAISSFGNNSSATCSLYDRLKRIYTNVIFTSSDGGAHWDIRDPGLPWRSITATPLLTAIQQIDSLNIVASGDSGVIVRTFDGGVTWEKQNISTVSRISSIHFSDRLAGIAVANTNNLSKSIYTTSDGGKTWDAVNYTLGFDLTRCYSYGNDKFSVFQSGRGRIITTNDHWKTKKIISNFVDSTIDSLWQYYQFTDCNFTGGDTICAFGGYGFHGTYGVIVRSIDGGMHWEKPYTFGNTFSITAMTSLAMDTVIAAGVGIQFVHISTDKGRSWRADSLVVDISAYVNSCHGLCWVGDGPLGVFAGPMFEGADAVILHGNIKKNQIRSASFTIKNSSIYPNPASSEVTVKPNCELCTIHIVDLLGREVLQGICTSENGIRFDTRKLHKGLYSVYSDIRGHLSVVGKFLIVEGN